MAPLPRSLRQALDAASSWEGSMDDEIPNGRRVLLVEDEDSLNRVLSRLLDSEGYEVVSHRCPVEALHAMDEAPGTWDLLVTDVRLPSMSGLELITAARQRQPELAVLAISATLPPEGGGELLEPREFLHKPFTATHFFGRLSELLAGRPVRQG